jgi:hypothetical protein
VTARWLDERGHRAKRAANAERIGAIESMQLVAQTIPDLI